ncbi:hypothetical protein [Cypionkella sp. TWP1-2-1b2]|uniref:hypothetical protein n=1 Tax=Cypionkella sp. TWP1-2-1b2 TaxID=2804675 RepID=UPI003CEA6EB4
MAKPALLAARWLYRYDGAALTEKSCMPLLSRLIRLLVAIAVVAMLGTAAEVRSGSGCLKISSVEMCMDPALRATGETAGDPLGKKCFDAILLADMSVDRDGAAVAVSVRFTVEKPKSSPVAPWKPPRVSA